MSAAVHKPGRSENAHLLIELQALSRFQRLPAELRNVIYSSALSLDEDEKQTLDSLLPPALTRVSRHIRRDTLPIYYGTNYFNFYIPDDDEN